MEKIAAILEAGRMAPTARNLQEQRIYVVQTAEAMAVIYAATPCRYGAPTVLVLAFNRETVFIYPGGKRDSGAEDTAIVDTHMILAAPTKKRTAAGSTTLIPISWSQRSSCRETKIS